MWLSRKLRFALMVFWGALYTPLPHRAPLDFVIGTPMVLEKKEDPTLEDIDKIHEEFILKMSALFHKYKKVIRGYEDKELIIC